MEFVEVVTVSILVAISAQYAFGQDISYLPVNPAGGCIQDVNFKEAGAVRYKTVNYRDNKRTGCLQMVKFPDRGRHAYGSMRINHLRAPFADAVNDIGAIGVKLPDRGRSKLKLGSMRIKNNFRVPIDDAANDIGAIGVNTGDINRNFIGYPVDASSGIGQIGVDTGRHFLNFFVPDARAPQKDLEFLGVNEGNIQSVTFYKPGSGRTVYRPYRSRHRDQPADVLLADIGSIGTNEGEVQEVTMEQQGRGRHRDRPRPEPYQSPRPYDHRRPRPFQEGIAQ